MKVFGIINASPDSAAKMSVVSGPEEALGRGQALLDEGAFALDLGGQSSGEQATVVSPEAEWNRLAPSLEALLDLGCPVSIDTWRPTVARRAFEMGATILNAADGLQAPGMAQLAAEYDCQIVLPFLSGPDPKNLAMVTGHPLDTMVAWFEQRLADADTLGIRENIVVDPGTGFGPANWDWPDRFRYVLETYQGLERLRVFGLPLYISAPWVVSEERRLLLDTFLSHDVEFVRSHFPGRVIDRRRELMEADDSG